ncbi:MAG TPA: hypothetical protein VIW29_22355 [Polyangiaceae bacterium]
MIDENAFGLLLSYYSIEDDEYSGERDEFVERYATFAALVRDRLSEKPPGVGAKAIDFGYAFYVEVLDGAEHLDLIAWLRELRATLGEHDFLSAGMLTHGSCWVDDADPRPDIVDCGSVKLFRASRPSEPLRRALLAEAATHGDEQNGSEGWGPGLYLDLEAVEALGRRPKNTPTILRSGGAEFFRAGS